MVYILGRVDNVVMAYSYQCTISWIERIMKWRNDVPKGRPIIEIELVVSDKSPLSMKPNSYSIASMH